MRKAIIPGLIALVLIGSACAETSKESTETSNTTTNSEMVELSGIALNRKGGAVLDVDGEHYWIDGKDSWDDEYLNKTLKAIGKVESRDDNPVVLANDEVISQGIPVETEAELEANKSRLWFIATEFTIVE